MTTEKQRTGRKANKEEETKMKIWFHGKYIEMNIGERVTVFKCGSGHSTYGEEATLTRTTERHLVFKTDSGATVKTATDNLSKVVGKAGKAGWHVHPGTSESHTEFNKMCVIL